MKFSIYLIFGTDKHMIKSLFIRGEWPKFPFCKKNAGNFVVGGWGVVEDKFR